MSPVANLGIHDSIILLRAQQSSGDHHRLATRRAEVVYAQQAIRVDHSYQIVAERLDRHDPFHVLGIQFGVDDALPGALLEFILHLVVGVLWIERDP